jgi:hypothetical protein
MSTTCYLAASYTEDAQALENILLRCGVNVVRPVHLSMRTPLLNAVRDAIDEAHFVCALLDASAKTTNAIFELGLAIGLNKSVLIIAQEDAKIPADLESSYLVRANLSEPTLITNYIESFLRREKKQRKLKRSSESLMHEPIRTQQFRSQINKILNTSPRNREQHLEEIIKTMLEYIGAKIRDVQRDRRAERPDFVFWADQFEGNVGNPIILEIKLVNVLNIGQVARQVTKYALNVNARLAIIVYKAKRIIGQQEVTRLPIPIVVISLDQFLEQISQGEFFSSTLAQRNKIVHTRS